MWNIGGGHRPERHGDREERARREAEWRRMAAQTRVTVGVDLGKMQDFTAIVIGERGRHDDDRVHHSVRSIERLALGTPYPVIADRVHDIITNLRAIDCDRRASGDLGFSAIDLVVDAGGVGVAVVDLFRERKLKPVPVTIVAGSDVHVREDGSLTVGKGHLIGSLEVLFQTDQLHLPDGPEADILEAELMDYDRGFTQAGNMIFNARSGRHDDLVLACALAVAVDVPRSPGGVLAWRIVKGRW